MTICAIGGYTYFITFTAYHSRYGYVYLKKHIFELLEKVERIWKKQKKKLEKVSIYFNQIKMENH